MKTSYQVGGVSYRKIITSQLGQSRDHIRVELDCSRERSRIKKFPFRSQSFRPAGKLGAEVRCCIRTLGEAEYRVSDIEKKGYPIQIENGVAGIPHQATRCRLKQASEAKAATPQRSRES